MYPQKSIKLIKYEQNKPKPTQCIMQHLPSWFIDKWTKSTFKRISCENMYATALYHNHVFNVIWNMISIKGQRYLYIFIRDARAPVFWSASNRATNHLLSVSCLHCGQGYTIINSLNIIKPQFCLYIFKNISFTIHIWW